MKYRITTSAILVTVFIVLFSSISFANSSWHWVTSSPFKVLPFAILFTLLIESYAILKFGKVANYKKTFLIVVLANVISFIMPYVIRAYRFIPTSGGFSLTAAFNKGPYFIVLGGYLILTLIIELPIVFLFLKKDSKKPMNLVLSILASNVVTTILVAFCERLICIGQW